MSVCDQDLRSALRMVGENTASSATRLPVDLVALAHRLGVRSIEPREMPAEGYLGTTVNGDLVIRYRSDRPSVRTRFTIAHELGHIFLAVAQGKQVGAEAFRAEGESSAEEIAVNRIAAEILMPETVVMRLLSLDRVSWRSVSRLCREFNVSVSAAVRRLLELREVPAMWMTLPLAAETEPNCGKWSLRVSRDPKLRFSMQISDIAQALYSNAVRSRVTDVEVYARDQKLVLPVVSRLVNRFDTPAYWCISWSAQNTV